MRLGRTNGLGITKDANGVTAVAPKVKATVDGRAHGLIVQGADHDALAGAVQRGKAVHIIVSFSGDEARALKAVK